MLQGTRDGGRGGEGGTDRVETPDTLRIWDSLGFSPEFGMKCGAMTERCRANGSHVV